MCFSGNYFKKTKYSSPEVMRINGDRLVFRSFLVLVILLVLGFVAYLLWCLQ